MPEFNADEYRTIIERAIRARIGRGNEAGRLELKPIAFERTLLQPRVNLPRAVRIAVFRRDGFTCRYCGMRTIPEPVMRLLAAVYPEEFPHDINWTAGKIHRSVPLLCTEIDHLVPVARGGAALDPSNLRTVCAPCNTRKSDFFLREARMEERMSEASGWDGLISLYRPFWEAAGRPDEIFHRPWIAAFEAT